MSHFVGISPASEADVLYITEYANTRGRRPLSVGCLAPTMVESPPLVL